ncbi:MAG: hypothetical protein H0V62_07340 [Gammaproteobacteria bacterium]|nr:hypothetical protein [Gammaproteobacteria bacterium]
MKESAIITRAGPARLLGLKNKAHLGAGAHADITIYDELDDKGTDVQCAAVQCAALRN